MGFAEDIKKKTERVKSEINESVNGMAKELFKTIIDKSPIDSGRLKSNWYVSFDKESSDADYNLTDISGSPSYARLSLLDNQKFYGKDGSVFLSTSVGKWKSDGSYFFMYPYAIEYYKWSDQQPMGMIRTSLVEIATKYKAI